MRIITGKYKGRTLEKPKHEGVRPTTDRMRETEFSILYSRGKIQDARVLDLFSGTGALGIEALSRGAASAVFCDKHSELTQLNLNKIGIEARVINADYRKALRILSGERFDLIFIDPPYGLGFEIIALETISKYGMLSKNGVIFLEVSSANVLINYEGYVIIDTRKIGDSALVLLKANSPTE